MEQLLKDINNFENAAVRRKALAAVTKIMASTGKILVTKDGVSSLRELKDFNPEKVDTAWEIRNGRFSQIPVKKSLSECMFVKF